MRSSIRAKVIGHPSVIGPRMRSRRKLSTRLTQRALHVIPYETTRLSHKFPPRHTVSTLWQGQRSKGNSKIRFEFEGLKKIIKGNQQEVNNSVLVDDLIKKKVLISNSMKHHAQTNVCVETPPQDRITGRY